MVTAISRKDMPLASERQEILSVIPRAETLPDEELEEALFFLDFLQTLIVIEGKKGSGKTLLSVALATKFKEYFDKNILMDFHATEEFGEYQYFDEKKFMEELQKVADISKNTVQEDIDLAVEWSLQKLGLDIEGAVLILDEAYRYFDCRTPTDKLVRVFGYFVAQMRHYHLTLILLCPSKRYLDRRVRDQIDFLGKVAFNRRTEVVHSRFLSYNTGEVKPLKAYGPNYFPLYDSWSPVIMRKKILDLRRSL